MSKPSYISIETLYKVLFLIGIFFSFCFGIWHFAIPWMFKWFMYIDPQYVSLINSIRWINILFSVFLTGIAADLFFNRRKIDKSNHFSVSAYVLLIIIWFVRMLVTIIYPFTGSYDWIFWVMIGIFSSIFVMILIPFIRIITLK